MDESPLEFKVVPNFYMNKLFLRKDLSRALLRGNTVFVVGQKKFGSVYTLAKNHGMTAHTRKGELDGKEGTFIQFKGDAQDEN